MAGLLMKYFVLMPKGNTIYARASRAAMRRYASEVESDNSQLAAELRKWADDEYLAVMDKTP